MELKHVKHRGNNTIQAGMVNSPHHAMDNTLHTSHTTNILLKRERERKEEANKQNHGLQTNQPCLES